MHFHSLRKKIIHVIHSSNEALKTYTYDEKNIDHIALVLYDLMPLSVKLAVRYEKFSQNFKVFFIKARTHLYPEVAVNNVQKKTTKRKPVAKKVTTHNVAIKTKKPRTKKISDE